MTAPLEQSLPPCLACSRPIQDHRELSRCIVHSCCSKPVCPDCLDRQPRLATFCVRCEGVGHALRKGPRDDVIHAGRVVFDLERSMAEQQDDPLQREEEGEGRLGHREPPPAYSAEQKEDADFTIGTEDDDQEEDSTSANPNTSRRTPTSEPVLLEASRWNGKRSVSNGHIDTSEQARGSSYTSAASSATPLTASLQNVLEAKVSDRDHTLTPPRRAASPKRPANGQHSTKTLAPAGETNTGLTRQYWLRPQDTLMSLSLRFRVSPAALCKLNDLPASTATSTPHLIHTRSFLLVPESAILSALEMAPDDPALTSALAGPAPMNRRQKVVRARKEAQSRFRSLVTKAQQCDGTGRSGDVMPCDERAARAYVALMENELRFVDFGDGDDFEEEAATHSDKADGKKLFVSDKASRSGEGTAQAAEDDALIDAARQRRYDAIVKQAVCRWEMDSDWEREQRAMGLEPVAKPIGDSGKSAAERSSEGRTPSWLRWLHSSITPTTPSLLSVEKKS